MEAPYKFYDEEQKIKIVDVAIKEFEGKRYTYLMADDYLALAKELLLFGFNDGFVQWPFIPNPHLSISVREAMEEAGATYSVFFGNNVHIMNRYVPGHEPGILNLTPFRCHISTWNPPLLSVVAMANAHRQVEFLLDSQHPIEQEDKHGRTALIIAAQNNALDAGKLLIERGATVDLRDSYGLTPLTAAVSINALSFAKLLLKNGAKVNRFSVETSPLLLAATMNFCDMIELLLENGADINITSPKGSTPLLEALRYSAQDAACLLIERGADIHVQDKQGYTPVRLLARQGLSQVLRKLLDAKLLTKQDKECALIYATIGNHLSLVKTLIYEKMDVNLQTEPEGFSLLALAVMGNYKEIVQFLLERGADVEIRDKMGLRPLDHAERDQRREIQKMLTLQYQKKNIPLRPAETISYQTLLEQHIGRYLHDNPSKRRFHLWKNTVSISKQLFSDITREDGYKTRKDKLIIIAAQLRLSVNELEELLAAAGFSLLPSSPVDTKIIHAFASGNHADVEPMLLQDTEEDTGAGQSGYRT